MAVITTKELFDAYFKTKDEVTVWKTRSQVDRPEVYAYETKIGKQLVDMNEEELFEMICTFNNKKSAVRGSLNVGSASFRKYVSNFRLIFQFYIDNYEVIRNPFHSAKFKGIQADALLVGNKSRFTYKNVEDVIRNLYSKYERERAMYYELVILLFYNGFSESQEIVSLTESQIDFRRKEVKLLGRTVKLSDRCFELLTAVHDMEIMGGMHGNFEMRPWHGGYFKFILRPKEAVDFQDKDSTYVSRKISAILSTKVSQVFGIDINYRKLYLLGFYDFIVGKYGEERVKEIITSFRVQRDIDDLTVAADEYGIQNHNMVYLKRSLVEFI